ncbi:MAG: hypothetical protein U1D67_04635 [Dehalococcoidia bacterium]|nr:hypothetical protein [Dehalococcoidia bacterium]
MDPEKDPIVDPNDPPVTPDPPTEEVLETPPVDPPETPPADPTARIAELETSLSERDTWITELETEAGKVVVLETSLTAAQESLERAVAKYKSLVAAGNPTIPPELIAGATIEDVDVSLVNARALVAKITELNPPGPPASPATPASPPAPPVPPGAPPRTPPDYNNLTPGEKIKIGISQT